MSTILSDVYRKEVFNLAKTMVIKHNGIAVAMNRYLSGIGVNVESDPTTWRYYLHLSGEYHPYDKPMSIINLDDINAGEVLLTRSLFENNRITRESYQYGSRFYRDLVNRFPEQESLILGMLNPVHINTAIDAEDGTILTYNKSLVEEYELYFIEDLEKWIKNYLHRWYNADYVEFNDRYLSVVLTDIYSKLPGKILQIRLNYCHTDHVHSYHVKQFLESNLRLGKFVPYMTRRTMMFLYRNLRWIMINAGKTHVFKLLINRILTEQNIPLTEHYLIRTIAEASDIVDRPNYGDDPYPDIKILPRSLNFSTGTDTGAFIDVDTIVKKQGDLLGYDDQQVIDYTKEAIDKTKGIGRNESVTKVLESIMIDNTNSVHFPLGRVIATHWIYYACSGLYPSNVSFINPSTNEQIILNTLDALILYCYMLHTALSPDLEPPIYIEKFAALGVFRTPGPTLSQLTNVVDMTKISQNRFLQTTDHEIYLPVLNNTGIFYNHCNEIQQFMMRQRYAWSGTSSMAEHAMLQNIAEQFYSSYELDPLNTENNDVLYTDWLEQKGLIFEGLERSDYVRLANELATLASGADTSEIVTVREIHVAMISLMERLSSYSIQYLRSITSADRLPLDWDFLRYDNWHFKETGHKWIGINDTTIAHYHSLVRHYFDIDVHNGVKTSITFKDRIRSKYQEKLFVRLNLSDHGAKFIPIGTYPISEKRVLVDLATMPVTSVQEYFPPE